MDNIDNMTSKSIAKIEELVTAKLKTSILAVEQERDGVYYLVGPNGVATKMIAGPDWHGEHIGTPSELVRFVAEHKRERSAVFYDDNRIVFVADLDDRRDIATCDLTRTPQYDWLCNPPGRMKQVDFIRMLRIILRGCISTDSGILTLARNLKFTTGTDGGANIQHGRESVGKSLRAEMSGETSMPEEARLSIPVFENYCSPSHVDCAIEIFPADGMLQLTPYPMQAKSAMKQALESIAQLFTSDDMPPVFHGAP